MGGNVNTVGYLDFENNNNIYTRFQLDTSGNSFLQGGYDYTDETDKGIFTLGGSLDIGAGEKSGVKSTSYGLSANAGYVYDVSDSFSVGTKATLSAGYGEKYTGGDRTTDVEWGYSIRDKGKYGPFFTTTTTPRDMLNNNAYVNTELSFGLGVNDGLGGQTSIYGTYGYDVSNKDGYTVLGAKYELPIDELGDIGVTVGAYGEYVNNPNSKTTFLPRENGFQGGLNIGFNF